MIKALEHKIASDLLPSVFGCEITPAERNIVSLPTRLGGLNIINPSESCDYSYTLSRRATNVVVDSLKLHSEFSLQHTLFVPSCSLKKRPSWMKHSTTTFRN